MSASDVVYGNLYCSHKKLTCANEYIYFVCLALVLRRRGAKNHLLAPKSIRGFQFGALRPHFKLALRAAISPLPGTGPSNREF